MRRAFILLATFGCVIFGVDQTAYDGAVTRDLLAAMLGAGHDTSAAINSRVAYLLGK